jgi:antitoxin ParD1/3/4
MPTRNVNLTPKQNAFIDTVIEAGEYQNASETIRDALRALQQRRREDALKLKALRANIRTGILALERGDYTEVEDSTLASYLDGLAAVQGKKRAR